jgi:hypothetical protein
VAEEYVKLALALDVHDPGCAAPQGGPLTRWGGTKTSLRLCVGVYMFVCA